jgi:hypothetical protein
MRCVQLDTTIAATMAKNVIFFMCKYFGLMNEANVLAKLN